MAPMSIEVCDMLTFDSSSHIYSVDGVTVPSVTGVISNAGLLGQAPTFYTPESAARGTRVHRACAEFDLGVIAPEMIDEERGYLESYQQWCALVLPQWTSIEQPAVSSPDFEKKFGYRFCGTADRVGTISGGPVVLDLKTGSPASGLSHAVQLAAYDLLHDDIPPGKRRRICLYLHRSGRKPKAVEFTSTTDYLITHKILQQDRGT